MKELTELAKLTAYLDLRKECQELLFRSITAENNHDRVHFGRKFHVAYKKLKAMEANK